MYALALSTSGPNYEYIIVAGTWLLYTCTCTTPTMLCMYHTNSAMHSLPVGSKPVDHTAQQP